MEAPHSVKLTVHILYSHINECDKDLTASATGAHSDSN